MARRKQIRKAEVATEEEVKALARVDQLAEAVADRLSESDRARWTGLALGLGFATLAGLIGMAIYLFLRRGAQHGIQGALGDTQPITIINQLPGAVAEVKKKAKKKPKPAELAAPTVDDGSEADGESATVSVMASTPDIPSRPVRLAPNAALRVATAGPQAWRMLLRAIGPAGSYVMIAGDARTLRAHLPGATVIRVGETQEVTLAPGDIMYGTGSDTGAALQVVAAEAIRGGQLRVVR